MRIETAVREAVAERRHYWHDMMMFACGINLVGVILIIAGLMKWSWFPDARLLQVLLNSAIVFFSTGAALRSLAMGQNRNYSEV